MTGRPGWFLICTGVVAGRLMAQALLSAAHLLTWILDGTRLWYNLETCTVWHPGSVVRVWLGAGTGVSFD